jgi:hypothetical protein
MPKSTKLDQDLKADYSLKPSTLEDIDAAVFEFINDSLNVFCDTNDGFKKVPVIFAGAERAFQIKNQQELREKAGTVYMFLRTLISIRKVVPSQLPDKSNKTSQESVRMQLLSGNMVRALSLLITRRLFTKRYSYQTQRLLSLYIKSR